MFFGQSLSVKPSFLAAPVSDLLSSDQAFLYAFSPESSSELEEAELGEAEEAETFAFSSSYIGGTQHTM